MDEEESEERERGEKRGTRGMREAKRKTGVRARRTEACGGESFIELEGRGES